MNKNKKIVLIGYSGHAFVAADTIMQAGYELVGYLDKQEHQLNPYKLNYLGFEEDEAVIKTLGGCTFFPAIGNNNLRSKVFKKIKDYGYEFITAIHPKANIASLIEVGEGTLICQGANINPLAQIGRAVIINTGAIIEHECQIGDFAHIAPGAVLAGNVTIGNGSFIGANAVVKQGISIGENVIIGAGAVVLNDIPDNVSCVGNPAKLLLK